MKDRDRTSQTMKEGRKDKNVSRPNVRGKERMQSFLSVSALL